MTATTTSTPNTRAHLRAQIDAFFARVGQGFNAYIVARARTEDIERLNAKSDAELARMGLQREDIPRYVFRDMLYL